MEARTPGHVEALLLHLGVIARDLDELLVGAHQSIGARHFAGERDESIVVVGDRCQQICVVSLNVAPQAAPEIQLPGRVEAEAKERIGLPKRALIGDVRAQEELDPPEPVPSCVWGKRLPIATPSCARDSENLKPATCTGRFCS